MPRRFDLIRHRGFNKVQMRLDRRARRFWRWLLRGRAARGAEALADYEVLEYLLYKAGLGA